MAVPILPVTLLGHTPAIAQDVMDDLNSIVAQMNANIDRTNLKDGEVITAKLADLNVTLAKMAAESVDNSKVKSDAALAYSKLAALAQGKILVGSAAGVPTPQTPSGAVAMTDAGAFSLPGLPWTDANLASPNNAVWRTIAIAESGIDQNFMVGGAGRHLLAMDGLKITGGSGSGAPILINWDSDHYAVAGKAIKMRLIGSLSFNNTNPGCVFTVGLTKVDAVAGGASTINHTLAASEVPGSLVSPAGQVANAMLPFVSGDFDPPADGIYNIHLHKDGAMAGTSYGAVYVQLQIKHV